MAKANVLDRCIRAYRRRIGELEVLAQHGTTERHEAAWVESERLRGLLLRSEEAFTAFLASRKKGPWAARWRALAES